MVDEARSNGELEAGLIDIYADNVGGTLGAGECAGEEANGAGAEDEYGRASCERCAAGSMEDDAEGLC